MPDLPDIHAQLPDAAHEALRAGLLAEIKRVDDALLLLLSTADFAQSTLNTAVAARSALARMEMRVASTEAALADLTQRVAALEPPPEPEPEPEPEPDAPTEV